MAGTPLWTFEPLTTTTVAVPANGTATVQYRVTNQSSKPHTLVMQPMTGIEQTTTGGSICGSPFVLRGKSSCILSLQINGAQLSHPIVDGPVLCQQGSTNQCYRPSSPNILRVTQVPPTTSAVISVTGSPLTLTVNGPTGQLTIHNTSTEVAATNVTSDFAGTALDGNVSETDNTCANVPPGDNCVITYMPGSMVVAQTPFTIRGTNTNALVAAIAVQSGSSLSSVTPDSGTEVGEAGVTLTGEGLLGATSVRFGGVEASDVVVVNSTTVTAVTPAHAPGPVDVVVDTPAGGATLVNGYTYLSTAVGQASGGGTIACLDGGFGNLIAAIDDSSTGIQWGGFGTAVGAESEDDGFTNTQAIIDTLGNNGGIPYAAQLCNDYSVDSQGNSPCQPGNTCYEDWFLPARSQLDCLYNNRADLGDFGDTDYWSSTEYSDDPGFDVWNQDFQNGDQNVGLKTLTLSVRCVRSLSMP
ncbi:MAG: DUF1566 domain-containing protein [Legionellaceae bacterium]|nr:DUF1566 domain-containing protein [Legionellaceae bacterium]